MAGSQTRRAATVALGLSDVILPSQFFGLTAAHHLSCEQRLMLAVLADAINILQGDRNLASKRRRQRFAEARQWLLKEDKRWPFSFDNVCEALGFEPETLRHRLIAMSEPAAPGGAGLGVPVRLRVKEASRFQHMTVNRRRRRKRGGLSRLPACH